MIASYRDPAYAASLRIAQLRERFGERGDDIPQQITLVHARRVARSWAGGVAVAGFVAMALTSLVRAVDSSNFGRALHPTVVLIGSVLLSLAVYVLARRSAAKAFVRRVSAKFDARGDALSRLARFETDAVRRAALDEVDPNERQSLALGMCGFSLLASLSIHLAVWTVIGGSTHAQSWLDGFDWWIGASLVLVGIAHLTLCVLCARFARKVTESSTAELEHKSPASGWAALGWTVLMSCVPGIVAIGIPPVIAAVTGLYIPVLYSVMHARALADRRALQS